MTELTLDLRSVLTDLAAQVARDLWYEAEDFEPVLDYAQSRGASVAETRRHLIGLCSSTRFLAEQARNPADLIVQGSPAWLYRAQAAIELRAESVEALYALIGH